MISVAFTAGRVRSLVRSRCANLHVNDAGQGKKMMSAIVVVEFHPFVIERNRPFGVQRLTVLRPKGQPPTRCSRGGCVLLDRLSDGLRGFDQDNHGRASDGSGGPPSFTRASRTQDALD